MEAAWKPVNAVSGAFWRAVPERPLSRYAKRQIIYSGSGETLYRLVAGHVKVSKLAGRRREFIAKVVAPGRLFGESSFVGGSRDEEASALDSVDVAAWNRDEVERIIQQSPLAGMALMEELVADSLELKDRLRVLSRCRTRERVMCSLSMLAALGSPTPDGSLRLPPLTQSVIAEHAGTSREIVTGHMNQFRRLGLVDYSRGRIEVNADAMRATLEDEGIRLWDRGAQASAGRANGLAAW